MLAADKLQLQSHLKQQATALKEKEFNLHHENLMTVGTQAAVLAALDITMFIEFSPPNDDRWPSEYTHVAFIIRMLYYGIIVGAFCANMLVVSHTTAVSVLAAGLALRGPDGSMMVATEGLYEERRSVFQVFGMGLALTVGSLLVSVWLLLRWQIAVVCWCIALTTCRQMYLNYQRVLKRFDFDERDTVDFADIFDGPAAIRGLQVRHKTRWTARGRRMVKASLSSPELMGVDMSESSANDHNSDHSQCSMEISMGSGPSTTAARRRTRASSRGCYGEIIQTV